MTCWSFVISEQKVRFDRTFRCYWCKKGEIIESSGRSRKRQLRKEMLSLIDKAIKETHVQNRP